MRDQTRLGLSRQVVAKFPPRPLFARSPQLHVNFFFFVFVKFLKNQFAFLSLSPFSVECIDFLPFFFVQIQYMYCTVIQK